MTAPESVDQDWSSWVGKTQILEDLVAPFPIRAMAATLDRPAVKSTTGSPVPPAWHWTYFTDVTALKDIGRDGHAADDGLLPPIPLPRRMWGGTRARFHRPLRIGSNVERRSEILSVNLKEGRTGTLAFVDVQHQFVDQGGVAIEEILTVVYRGEAVPGSAESRPQEPPEGAIWNRSICPDPVLLFRYSALTFNSHRIHYDHPYVTEIEGYEGLIVHGPLTATLLLDLVARERPGAQIESVAFRAMRPLYAGQNMSIRGMPEGAGCRVWAEDATGAVAMTADVTFV